MHRQCDPYVFRCSASARLRFHNKSAGPPGPAGQAKMTRAYNLPCRYVLHTVGPAVAGAPSQKDRDLLASCYRSCLALAEKHGLRSIAFCCISTGEFHFPRREAAEIAVKTVKEYLNASPGLLVVFNVFTEEDHKIYMICSGRSSTGESSSAKSRGRLKKRPLLFAITSIPRTLRAAWRFPAPTGVVVWRL